jgi:hypothetical protein
MTASSAPAFSSDTRRDCGEVCFGVRVICRLIRRLAALFGFPWPRRRTPSRERRLDLRLLDPKSRHGTGQTVSINEVSDHMIRFD